MISLEEALTKIDRAVEPLEAREVALTQAIGCALAEEITAKFDVPDFASSAMDGIAVAHEHLQGKSFPIELTIQGTIPAGKPVQEPLQAGHAFRIMTGAALPAGADTVIKVEELEFTGDFVRLMQMPGEGDHVRPAGNDIKAGTVIFSERYELTTLDAGICASLGLREISVYPHPKVAVMATGSEIISPGESLGDGQIYNSNDVTLKALLEAQGFRDIYLHSPSPDDIDKLIPIITRLCSEYDVVITSGAVSMGNFDYIPDVVKRLGGDLLFHKVFVKPGKPALVARIGRSWLLALPGNPVSVAVTFQLYGKRLIDKLMAKDTSSTRERAILTESFSVKGDRFQVIGAHLKRKDGQLLAQAVQNYSSGRLSSIKGTNGFIFVPGGSRQVQEGISVDVEWL
ncbi:hypothetical protein CEE37_07640 [candidate division LCP-89 bacterium B3_LCP]|uniref:Molybdopterin molybdenumtransferase n=1 Tax=candidate division LCP-89 bacterium B3_LCP TaxID=2012998 RepID=A0A532V0Y4_UNCL8|nr:MAG: hypothetical protein CEE37_07640 [candidate division LCP-89 bacterium B3_LCP]